jgi:uncharacterized protein (TIGR02453 family)
MTASKPRTTPDLFAFLRELKENNDRAWFEAQKERYESSLREPLRQLIRDMAPALAAISDQFVADDRKSGGSLMRIHRDVRFSNDKSPYKTNAGLQFRHRRGKDAHAPGYYIHFEPGNVFLGAGIWAPETKVSYQVRAAIDADRKGWLAATKDKAFAKHWSIWRDEALQRPPQGYKADHPLIEDLKLKHFIAQIMLNEEDACAAGFAKKAGAHFAAATPFMRFVTEAVGEQF